MYDESASIAIRKFYSNITKFMNVPPIDFRLYDHSTVLTYI